MLTLAIAADSPNDTHQELICTPFGVCEPCPPDELDKPFCQPFGNRRLMHCQNATTSSTSFSPSSRHRPHAHKILRFPLPAPPPPPHQDTDHHNPVPLSDHPHSSNPHTNPNSRPSLSIGETPAWESCGRIISQERADFYEFVACNLLFAIGAILVVYIRSRRRHAMHARQLAARIGLIARNGGSGGR
ncbi:hypothetical protein GYMLUDRAFT_34731 [Collybiopsis luxurians FD-317 M1]|nr:hypothetical protein GYMLUDRAFT_34731 [Collybiopsis luxurians FD-317 M1]